MSSTVYFAAICYRITLIVALFSRMLGWRMESISFLLLFRSAALRLPVLHRTLIYNLWGWEPQMNKAFFGGTGIEPGIPELSSKVRYDYRGCLIIH